MGQEQGNRRVKIFLTLPRCGTHFIWSRLVQSGSHQLIYDADRIPALTVLSRHCDEKLDFLCPPPKNPNYNFQYNSLADLHEPLTAAEHLDRLAAGYGEAAGGLELFRRIMALQDAGRRSLFAVNRFCYTIGYDFLFKQFQYTIQHAIEALQLLHEWVHAVDPEAMFVLVIRKVPEWIASQFAMYGPQAEDMIAGRLKDLPPLLEAVRRLGLPVYLMGEVIAAFKRGDYDLLRGVQPISGGELDSIAGSVDEHLANTHRPGVSVRRFRLGRFIQYLGERDPINRTSLVRSIGAWPQNYAGFLPLLGRRIRTDYEGLVLNNARIRQPET